MIAQNLAHHAVLHGNYPSVPYVSYAIDTLIKEGEVDLAMRFQVFFKISSEYLPVGYQSQAIETAMSLPDISGLLHSLSTDASYNLIALLKSTDMPPEDLKPLPKGFILGEKFQQVAKNYIQTVLLPREDEPEWDKGLERLRAAGIPVEALCQELDVSESSSCLTSGYPG